MNFEEIKRNFSVYEVAVNKLGLKLRPTGGGEYRGVSLAPGPHTHDDGLSVSGDLWQDFTAGVGGSVLDLVAYVKFGKIDKHSIVEAAKFLAGDSYDSGYWTNYAAQREGFSKTVEAAHAELLKNSQVLEYLYSRRITDETIKRFKLGVGEELIKINGSFVKEVRLVCPYLDESGNPIYGVSRSLPWAAHEGSPKYKKLWTGHPDNVFLKNSLFGLNTLPRKDSDCDTLALGEGLFDILSAIQEGYPALSAIGGNFSEEQYPIILQQARRFRRITTFFDIDKNMAGQSFTCKLGMKFLHEKLNFSCITSYGEGHKDLSDYYTAGGDIGELINSAVNGYEFMSRYTFWERSMASIKELATYYPFYSLSANEKAKALAEVKKFVRGLKKFLPECQSPSFFGGDMQHVLDALAEYYPPEAIAKFNEPPTAQEVLCDMRDQFLDGRHVLFNGSIKGGSYFEYQPAGYWARMTDSDMQSEISAHFKHEQNNKTVSQLTMMTRLMTTQPLMPKFNKKRLWLFGNGVFDLDTGELREPKPEDNLSWQVRYNYDAQAECPTFDKFLAECADNEPSRIEYLTDLLGYLPFENNRLEKIFVLIGEGSNGKSTFCNVLENLISSTNERDNSQSVTHIQPATFDKPTELMQLEGSILNLAYDIDTDLRGCESALKSISSGDTISGNLKFHDTVSFTPRCKLIFTSNRMIRVNDDSYGMRRRLMFCRFANDFTGREDTHLREKLIAELPGIFNKMYRAYKALLEREKELGNRAIRPCIDQTEFISEFSQAVSAVAAFWAEHKEELIGREVKKADIFDQFKEYCERNGRFSGAENSFHRKLKNAAENDGITIEGNIKHKEGNKQVYYMRFNPPADDGAKAPETPETTATNEPEAVQTETTAQTTDGSKWKYDPKAYHPDKDNEQLFEEMLNADSLELDE